MTPAEAADFIEEFARRYVAERERVPGPGLDSVKAQAWAILMAAAQLRRQSDTTKES